jgi:hypothetical protein
MVANSGGPTFQSQVIGAVVNPMLWVGRLGLNVKPSNFSEFENPQRGLIPTLKDEECIPSLTYGYTAGAYYSKSEISFMSGGFIDSRNNRKPTAWGRLTFGGYDQSRFVPNNITFPFDTNDSRKPSLNIQAIISQDFQRQNCESVAGWRCVHAGRFCRVAHMAASVRL